MNEFYWMILYRRKGSTGKWSEWVSLRSVKLESSVQDSVAYLYRNYDGFDFIYAELDNEKG